VNAIGSLNENPLHAAVKAWYAHPGDRLEAAVDGYVVDLVRADGELVEVQTAHFGLAALLPSGLPDPFTTADLAAASGLSRRLAGQMAFCLREMGQIQAVGRRGNGWLYR